MKDKMGVRLEDVFDLTPLGVSQLQASSTLLPPEQLELLVLVDGRSTVEALTKRVKLVKAEAVEGLLALLFQRGLITYAQNTHSDNLDFTAFFSARAEPSADALAAAGSEASEGASSLQKIGYYVRIARSAGIKRVLAEGEKLNILVVEDEPHLAKLLRTYLILEGFDARVAENRDQILAELRRPPIPSLILLDVMLPDADGFDILAGIRRHPALRSVPVVMLTGLSTREAVLKGLAGGADGYITKPFEVDVLMKAVRSVLGLPPA